jgi:hypothetical protein
LAGSPAAREGFLALDSEVRKIEASLYSRSGSVEKREDVVVVVVAIRKFRLLRAGVTKHPASIATTSAVVVPEHDYYFNSSPDLLVAVFRLLQTL